MVGAVMALLDTLFRLLVVRLKMVIAVMALLDTLFRFTCGEVEDGCSFNSTSARQTV